MKSERGNLVRMDGLKRYFLNKIELDKSQALKVTAIPCTGLERTRGFQEIEASRFHDSRYMKMVSPMHCRLYPQEIFLVTISVRG
jgi:hypothetical protein